MKKSEKVTIALISAIMAGGVGASVWDTERNKPQCMDQQTGKKVDVEYCEHAYHYGNSGRYGMVYRNPDGSTSTVDAGDKSAVTSRGGFGSDGYSGSGGG